MDKDKIEVLGARVHNLKNIDVVIPRNSLTVFTGLSGSGKSSLAFDTIYAEGQRRYIETFSAYARNFLGNMERPDVDKITGLSPVIAIEQKTTNKNPRSTVGTTTEIYDYLRLLFARAATAYSYQSGEKMVKYTEEKVVSMILKDYLGKKIFILAPLVRNRKGHYRELFESMRRKGYLYIRIDGEILELTQGMKTDRYKNHNIEVVVDKMKLAARLGETEDNLSQRLQKTVATAMRQGDGLVMIIDADTGEAKFFSKRLMDPVTGLSYKDPAPNIFSFNSPEGACPHCKGLGMVSEIDLKKVIPDDRKSIREGAIAPLGKYKSQMIFWQIEAILSKYDLDLKSPVKDIPQEAMDEILYGALEKVRIAKELVHTTTDYFVAFDGVVKYLRAVMEGDESAAGKKWSGQFIADVTCGECQGQRLNREALSYKIWGKNISELSEMDLGELYEWMGEVGNHLGETQRQIATEIIKEIRKRIRFLLDVGLDYLSLNRQSASLSGGESQRIRLATQIGSQLVNVLYILDEPSIGLHQRDNVRLINSLKALRDLGNTVIVVEHDEDTMRSADYIVDVGPGAGVHGGEIVAAGSVKDICKAKRSITGDYLSGRKRIEVPQTRRTGNGNYLTVKGARENNLRNIDVKFPLGEFICVTGISGSGKSSLINEILYKTLACELNGARSRAGKCDGVEGLEFVDKVIGIDQQPIGRTPRSNPATYTGVFNDIRTVFSQTQDAKMRGYGPGRFSFNVKGGRCEACEGNGILQIEMHFLPDVYVPCEVCKGARYNRETLEVKYKEKTISDVLNMTVEEAVVFFANQPKIARKLQTLLDVGLGYVTLGQSATTLSGGEAQRVKLANELARRSTGKTVYILDEPTTGLHIADVHRLIEVLQKLVDAGNTVIVIEHNLDLIKCADHIIDLGPEGGSAGGEIVAEGTPEQVAEVPGSFTGQYLKPLLEKDKLLQAKEQK